MRVVIAGAGSVGRSIARELLRNGHHVLLVDRDADGERVQKVPDASWLQADACEIEALSEAGLAECDVVVAATGDDKVNLVLSLLAKTEFGVPRTVARVNNPKNEWMFDEAWGVDVAVSTPRLMTALVEEAVSVGDLVRIFEFQQGKAMMVEMTLPVGSPYAGSRVGDVPLPGQHGAHRHHPRGAPDRPQPRRRPRAARRAAVHHDARRRGRAGVAAQPRSAPQARHRQRRRRRRRLSRRPMRRSVSRRSRPGSLTLGAAHGRQVTPTEHGKKPSKSIKEKRAEKHAKADAKNHIDLGKK